MPDLMPELEQIHPLAAAGGTPLDVTDDVALVETLLVNCYLVGRPGSGGWVLVDSGIPGFAGRIRRAAARRFGGDLAPAAVILTHGHFDHVGSLPALLEEWPQVPVYAHELELPYLTGRSAYPPPDPTVGGGIMARTSPFFPNSPYDFRPHIRPLPADGSVPGLAEWRWIHTPGHSPGHVSLFRDSDRALIAGDAFTTQQQESFLAVMTNYQEIHGPPSYYTIDWPAAERSVRTLRDLQPLHAGTGHGLPMHGPRLRQALDVLLRRWWDIAVPRHGRYVREPARADQTGVTYLPPKPFDPFPWVMGAVLLAGIGAAYAVMKEMEDSDWLG